MATTETIARYSREHNGANVLTLGASLITPDEELARRTLLPPTPQVGTEHAVVRRVLDEAADEHPRRESVVGPRPKHLGREASGREVDEIDRDRGFDRQPNPQWLYRKIPTIVRDVS